MATTNTHINYSPSPTTNAPNANINISNANTKPANHPLYNIGPNRARFISLLEEYVPETFLAYLDGQDPYHPCDFYKAPASTKYHEAYEGGLLQHSLNVYDHLTTVVNNSNNSNNNTLSYLSPSSIAKASLLHDMCKVNFYRRNLKNQKLEDGTWIRTLGWEIQDTLPLGHGEKSLAIILRCGVHLTEEEMLAIRWHMGAFEGAHVLAYPYPLQAAMKASKLVAALHLADMMAAWL